MYRRIIQKLHPRFNILAEKIGLDGSYGFYSGDYSSGERRQLSEIESWSHELAHALALSLKLQKKVRKDGMLLGVSDWVGETISADMKDEEKDRQEVLACAIEVLALRHYKIRVNIQDLTAGAARNMHNCSGRKALRMVQKAMKTKRVAALVQRFIVAVENS